MRHDGLRGVSLVILALAVVPAVPAAGHGQENLATPTKGDLPAASELLEPRAAPSAWAFRLIPYGWVPGLHGDLTVRGVTAPIDVSIGKVFNILTHDLNFAALGQIEADNGRFGIIFNGDYVSVSPDRKVRRLDFDSDFQATFLDCAATLDLAGAPARLGLPPESRLQLLAGFRYVDLSAGLTVTGPLGNTAHASGAENWVDPIVGGRLRVPLMAGVTGQVRGDFGGFGIGDACRFTWNVEAMLEYRMSGRCSLVAGYRWLDLDRAAGDASQRFHFDVNLSGPVVGLALDF